MSVHFDRARSDAIEITPGDWQFAAIGKNRGDRAGSRPANGCDQATSANDRSMYSDELGPAQAILNLAERAAHQPARTLEVEPDIIALRLDQVDAFNRHPNRQTLALNPEFGRCRVGQCGASDGGREPGRRRKRRERPRKQGREEITVPEKDQPHLISQGRGAGSLQNLSDEITHGDHRARTQGGDYESSAQPSTQAMAWLREEEDEGEEREGADERRDRPLSARKVAGRFPHKQPADREDEIRKCPKEQCCPNCSIAQDAARELARSAGLPCCHDERHGSGFTAAAPCRQALQRDQPDQADYIFSLRPARISHQLTG